MKTHCPQGHELTDNNLRRRPGKRATWRECLTCYREAKSTRERANWSSTDQTVTNRTRNARAQAKSMGLKMVRRGEVVRLFDAVGEEVESGTLDYVEAYLTQRYVRRRPGPSPLAPSDKWAPLYSIEPAAPRVPPLGGRDVSGTTLRGVRTMARSMRA